MGRRLVAAGVASLVLAPSAAADVTVTPSRVEPGADVVLTFAVPNETEASPVVRVRIAGPDFDLDDAQAVRGWRLTVNRRPALAVTWSGGAIPRNGFGLFSLRGTAPRRTVRDVFTALAVHADGSTDRYSAPVVVQSAPARGRDSGARTLGKAALGVAIVAGLVAVGTFFLALTLWLRRPE